MLDEGLQCARSHKMLKLLLLANKSIYNSKYTFRQFAKGYNHRRSYSVSSWLICSRLSTLKIIMLSKLYSFSYQSNTFFLLNPILTVIRAPLCFSICNYSVIKSILFYQYQETHFSTGCETGRNIIPKCRASLILSL